MDATQKLFEVEKPAGAPDVTPVDPTAIDGHRRAAHESLFQYLRKRLVKSHASRESLWRRDYTNAQAYRRSVEPMRAKLKEILGYWTEAAQRPRVRTRDEQVIRETSDFRA